MRRSRHSIRGRHLGVSVSRHPGMSLAGITKDILRAGFVDSGLRHAGMTTLAFAGITATTILFAGFITAEPLKGKLVLTGSSTVAPLASEIGKRFESRHPETRVDVQSGGSSRGIADARSGLADIGLCSRALKNEEKDLFSFTTALDGVGVILHKKNPVTALSDEQVVEIYTGKITNWKEVGGKDAPITVVNKAEGRSTLELFCHYYKLGNKDIKPQVIIGDNAQGIKTVAGNPNAIGYVSIGSAEYEATHGVPVKLLPVGGVKASLANVKNGTFPISRPLNFVTNKQPSGLVKVFIDFATSLEVQDIVRDQYFVSLPKFKTSN